MPGCSLPLPPQSGDGGRKEGNRKKGKDGEVGRRHEIRFVLTTKAIRRAEREEKRQPREVEECSSTTCRGRARRRRLPWPGCPRQTPLAQAGLSHCHTVTLSHGPGCAQPGNGAGRGGGGGRHDTGLTYPENDIEAEDEIFDATTDFRPLVVLSGHPLRSSRRFARSQGENQRGKGGEGGELKK